MLISVYLNVFFADSFIHSPKLNNQSLHINIFFLQLTYARYANGTLEEKASTQHIAKLNIIQKVFRFGCGSRQLLIKKIGLIKTTLQSNKLLSICLRPIANCSKYSVSKAKTESSEPKVTTVL